MLISCLGRAVQLTAAHDCVEFRDRSFNGKIRQPTLFIWGQEDGAFGRVAAIKTGNYVDGPFRFRALQAGHLLMLERPDLVAQDVISHLSTWTQVSQQWKSVLADTPQQDGSPCDQSGPHCLKIFVAPSGSEFADPQSLQ